MLALLVLLAATPSPLLVTGAATADSRFDATLEALGRLALTLGKDTKDKDGAPTRTLRAGDVTIVALDRTIASDKTPGSLTHRFAVELDVTKPGRVHAAVSTEHGATGVRRFSELVTKDGAWPDAVAALAAAGLGLQASSDGRETTIVAWQGGPKVAAELPAFPWLTKITNEAVPAGSLRFAQSGPTLASALASALAELAANQTATMESARVGGPADEEQQVSSKIFAQRSFGHASVSGLNRDELNAVATTDVAYAKQTGHQSHAVKVVFKDGAHRGLLRLFDETAADGGSTTREGNLSVAFENLRLADVIADLRAGGVDVRFLETAGEAHVVVQGSAKASP